MKNYDGDEELIFWFWNSNKAIHWNFDNVNQKCRPNIQLYPGPLIDFKIVLFTVLWALT